MHPGCFVTRYESKYAVMVTTSNLQLARHNHARASARGSRAPHAERRRPFPLSPCRYLSVAPVAVVIKSRVGVWAGHGPRARRRENQVFSVHHKLGMMIYNRHARELATKGRALSPLSIQYGYGRVGHDKVASAGARPQRQPRAT